jgi:hypothetical protein
MAKEPIRCVVVPVGADPHIAEIDPDDTLAGLQGLVGGLIESCPHVFGDTPSVFVNEEGKVTGLRPNRAVYAAKEHVVAGFRSPDDPSRPIAEGELLDVVYGNFVCVGFDGETGATVSITDEEVARVMDAFCGWRSQVSGAVAVAGLCCGPGQAYVIAKRERADCTKEALAVNGEGEFIVVGKGAPVGVPISETEAEAWYGEVR